ncbi:hypothetical protein BV25DRAFT_1348573 [Artomyces pyxidatus]|uniref:Uncharacterized protein n=1 Tax=Artomyces pyxidatus TaxID=48021 RepID=A0ACB8SMW3_9AGAM|nr:hypothetical protein BV25DRAFT_1348573 [Artomyces pyxidatus]
MLVLFLGVCWASASQRQFRFAVPLHTPENAVHSNHLSPLCTQRTQRPHTLWKNSIQWSTQSVPSPDYIDRITGGTVVRCRRTRRNCFIYPSATDSVIPILESGHRYRYLYEKINSFSTPAGRKISDAEERP